MWGRHARHHSSVPAWAQERNKPRVLIECGDSAEGWATEKTLESEGYEVVVCPGPEGLGRSGCVLLPTGGKCAALDGADLVVSLLSLSQEVPGVVHRAIGMVRPTLPHIIEIGPGDLDFVPEIRGNVISLQLPASDRTLKNAVARALARPTVPLQTSPAERSSARRPAV
jgi:hypothetical protein